jgi:3-phosphoshikimate 1-carboxyvinyltransferase
MAFVALVPGSKISIVGLNENSLQGDKKMLELIEKFNVSHYWENDKLILFHEEKEQLGKKFTYNFSDMPDQAQTVSFLCAALGIDMELSGLETLLYKETNRIKAISNELRKLGLDVQESNSGIKIKGKIDKNKVRIKTYSDHRMAMSASLLGTRMETIIEDPDVVSKSYPTFWEDLKKLTNES